MYSNFLKYLFVCTAYAPTALIYWIVLSYNSNCYEEKLYLLGIFVGLLLICWFVFRLAKTKLTINAIELKSIKSADTNISAFLISYFLPCIELVKKDDIYLYVWLSILVTIVFVNKSTFNYNPILKLFFGYRYYDVQTSKDISYTLLSKKKLINKNQVNTYTQLTDYVILDASN